MSLKRRQWNNLLEALENGSCIVLLGPMVSTVANGGLPLAAQFAKELSETLEDEEVTFDKAHEHNLTYIMQRFMTIDGVTSSDPGYEAKKFYEKHEGQINSVQKLVAELPVSLVINTSPDDGIVQALKQSGKYKTVHAWYNYRQEEYPDVEIPNSDAPLVYNLFGHYKDPQSLVLTESDQVEFVSNVVKDQPPLPPKLLRQFDSFKTYLFLGFDWEQWNLRLILQSLNLEKESNILAHSRHDISLQEKTKDFYQSSFRFSFVTENIADFVKELHDRYNAHAGEEVVQKKLVIVSDSKDESFRDELHKNLKLLPLKSWHKGLIGAGEDIAKTFQQQMDSAEIILLLISSDFLASDAIYNNEWRIALQRHQDNKSKVIPIITRSCNWQHLKELTQMPSILPRKNLEVGKAITSWENPDDAYQMIVQEIEGLLK